jgi:hypothetical protein
LVNSRYRWSEPYFLGTFSGVEVFGILSGKSVRSDAGFFHQVRPQVTGSLATVESPFPTAENWRGPKVGQIHLARWAASLWPMKHCSLGHRMGGGRLSGGVGVPSWH